MYIPIEDVTVAANYLGEMCSVLWSSLVCLPFFWYTSRFPCSLLIPDSIRAVRPLRPGVRNVCVAEITVSIAKWGKQKRVKMMTQIRLFSALLPLVIDWKNNYFGRQANLCLP